MLYLCKDFYVKITRHSNIKSYIINNVPAGCIASLYVSYRTYSHVGSMLKCMSNHIQTTLGSLQGYFKEKTHGRLLLCGVRIMNRKNLNRCTPLFDVSQCSTDPKMPKGILTVSTEFQSQRSRKPLTTHYDY